MLFNKNLSFPFLNPIRFLLLDILMLNIYYYSMRRIPDSERLYVLVGQKVERQRLKARLSQTQLAQLCDLARGSIANIESGKQRPTLHTLWSLADALSVDMRSLLPSPDEFLMSETGNANPKITGRLKKVAGESQNQVASFIASSREEVSPNVDGENS